MFSIKHVIEVYSYFVRYTFKFRENLSQDFRTVFNSQFRPGIKFPLHIHIRVRTEFTFTAKVFSRTVA